MKAPINNTLKNLIVNRIREVTVTDSATGESKTTTKAVNLKAGDFQTKDNWKAYNRALLEFAPIMQKAAAALDGTDESEKTAARKAAVNAMQNIVNIICKAAALDAYTVQKKEINYIARLAYARKLDKDTKEIRVDVKSKNALQTLFEDILYYRVNGKKLPSVTLTDSAQAALDKAHMADAKAAQGKANETKTIPAAKSKKAASATKTETAA